jgi:hypothetical protein
MPTYEEWELKNAAHLLTMELPMKFPGNNIKIIEFYLDELKAAVPKIIIEGTATHIATDINKWTFKINGQSCTITVNKIGGQRYCFTLGDYESLELLIRAANQKACDILNNQLACIRDGMELWAIYPTDKSKESSTIPHLRSYVNCKDSEIGKACIYEVMEKMMGRIFTEAKKPLEAKRYAASQLSGGLSYQRDAANRYYLCYENYSLAAIAKKPLMLYLFSSLDELVGDNTSYSLRPK